MHNHPFCKIRGSNCILFSLGGRKLNEKEIPPRVEG